MGGFGRVNLLASLPVQGQNDLNLYFENSRVISTGEIDQITVSPIQCSAPLSVSLVWTDPPVSAYCTRCVLNDLDPRITSMSDAGQVVETFYPNGRNNRDPINNAERIRIDAPLLPPFTYVVEVEAFDVMGPQAYSLVITGCFTAT